MAAMSDRGEVTRRKREQINSELLDESHRIYPSERALPRSDGPWIVVPSERKPYKFAVIGKDKRPIAFSSSRETAENYAKQMENNGYIEVDA